MGVVTRAQQRGRDSWGVASYDGHELRTINAGIDPEAWPFSYAGWVIGNTRAEPTTEYVADKTPADVQPFVVDGLVVAHNGVIANDRELCELYGVDPDRGGGSQIDTARWTACLAHHIELENDPDPGRVLDLLENTVGSYAIAVGHRGQGWLVLANNYRPIWLRQAEGYLEFSSVSPRSMPLASQLREGWVPMPANTALIIQRGGNARRHLPISGGRRYAFRRTLVVASGGLDSTVAAVQLAQERGRRNVDLLHITYGCRAQQAEGVAVSKLAGHMGLGLHHLDLTDIFAVIGGSRLTSTAEVVAGGEAGAEFAHEWVPARNTIMLAVAAGYAEAHGYTNLALGTNIEEAGAYPDNEGEFIERFGDLLPFVVGPASPSITIDQPVGMLTKREIVMRGLAIKAPLDLTWSCYENGRLHCGVCGPCYMRRSAFAMVGAVDPIEYAQEATA